MTIRVGEPFGKLDEKDNAFLVKSTEVKGSYVSVADIAARDNLFTAIREEGMRVHVRSNKKDYRLEGGVTNDKWVEAAGGGGATELYTVESILVPASSAVDANTQRGKRYLAFKSADRNKNSLNKLTNADASVATNTKNEEAVLVISSQNAAGAYVWQIEVTETELLNKIVYNEGNKHVNFYRGAYAFDQLNGGGLSTTSIPQLTDVKLTPDAFQGILPQRKLVSRTKIGKKPTDPDAIEYVSRFDEEEIRYHVRKIFLHNGGYRGAGTAFVKPSAQAVEGLVEIKPTSAQPAIIYLNKEGIGDPSAAPNDADHNSYTYLGAWLYIRLNALTGLTPAAPTHQRYRLTFYGNLPNGTAGTSTKDVDMYSLGIGDYQDFKTPMPDGLAGVNRVEFSLIAGDAVSQASKGLVIRDIAILTSYGSLGSFTPSQENELLSLLMHGNDFYAVDDSPVRSNLTYTKSGHNGKTLFVTESFFSYLTGLTNAEKALIGKAGIVRADSTNDRWEVLFNADAIDNGLVLVKAGQYIYIASKTGTVKQIHPVTLENIDNFSLRTATPEFWDSLIFRPNEDYSSGTWDVNTNILNALFKRTSLINTSGEFSNKVSETVGTDAGAGTPAFKNGGALIDVRKDSSAEVFFNAAQTEVDLAAPGGMHYGFIGKGDGVDDQRFEYEVTITGAKTDGTALTQTTKITGLLGNTDRWYTSSLDEDMKKVTSFTFKSVSGNADALAQHLLLSGIAIIDGTVVEGLPNFGGGISLSSLRYFNANTVDDPDEWSILQFRPDAGYKGTGAWESLYNPIALMFKAGASFSSTRSYNEYIKFTKGADAAAGTSRYIDAGVQVDVSKDSKLEIHFRKDKQEQDLALPGGMKFAMFGFSALEKAFELNVKVSGKNTAGGVITSDIVLSGKGGLRDRWFTVDLPVTFKSVLKVEITDAGKNTSKDVNFGSMAIIDTTALTGIPDIGESDTFPDPGEF